MKLALTDIYGFGCGVYLSYANSKGIDVNVDFLSLSPAIFSGFKTYVAFKFIDILNNKLKSVTIEEMIENSNLSYEDEEKFIKNHLNILNNLDNILINSSKRIIYNSTKTALFTFAGYSLLL